MHVIYLDLYSKVLDDNFIFIDDIFGKKLIVKLSL